MRTPCRDLALYLDEIRNPDRAVDIVADGAAVARGAPTRGTVRRAALETRYERADSAEGVVALGGGSAQLVKYL